MKLLGPVCSTEVAVLQIIKDLRQDEFCLADAHSIAVRQRFFGHEAWVHPAHDDGYTPATIFISDFVTAIHIRRHGRNADKIGLEVKINRLDVLVCEDYLVTVARNSSGDSEKASNRRI